jgi:LPXTG-motif cell wall-anchored protein
LPVTGSPTGLLAMIGLALLGAGALLVGLRRRLER